MSWLQLACAFANIQPLLSFFLCANKRVGQVIISKVQKSNSKFDVFEL